MANLANFRVDPRLTFILGEGYRSSEQALKELIDNAWDADATEVYIELSEPLSGDPIIIRDNGSGMTEIEIRSDYLTIANDRRTRRGEQTLTHKRKVKGRKGIGKFAGLLIADNMQLETHSRGTCTKLTVSKAELIAASENLDLEKINLPLLVKKSSEISHGTTITLTHFNQKLSLPTPESLRELLMNEYGSNPDFKLYVNGEIVDLDDITGTSYADQITIPDIGTIYLKMKVSENARPLKQSGITFFVGGKAIGPRGLFGLEQDEEIPAKLLKRFRAEIEADGLDDATTADWGAFIENDKGFQYVKGWAIGLVKQFLSQSYRQEIHLMRARLQRQVNERLSNLPEYRREAAQTALERILSKFYDDKPERQESVVNVVLDAFERDEYWQVIQKVDEARHRDVEELADALTAFGLLEIARIAQQAKNRLKILDDFDLLIVSPNTLESAIHRVLETNLWILGSEYELMTSNRSLKNIIQEFTNSKYTGERAKKRPDLLLITSVQKRYVLIELKKPSENLTRAHESQAKEYRDDLQPYFPSSLIEVIVVGGPVSNAISQHYATDHLKMLSIHEVSSLARVQLEWLLQNLKKDL